MPEPSAAEAGPLLSVSDLRAGYGIRPVLHGLSFDVRAGETTVLLGLNGAGKTTTARVLAGALAPWTGHVVFDGRPVTGWRVGVAVRAGVVMVPERRHVFPELSVERNLEVGAWSQRRDRDWLRVQRERVLGYFPRLQERLHQAAGTLSGGEQQMLAIARALMARPRVLVVDEASLGLAPTLVRTVFDIVRRINADGVTVILIEQHVGALEVADSALVMEQGTIVARFEGADLQDPARVRALFLGEAPQEATAAGEQTRQGASPRAAAAGRGKVGRSPRPSRRGQAGT